MLKTGYVIMALAVLVPTTVHAQTKQEPALKSFSFGGASPRPCGVLTSPSDDDRAPLDGFADAESYDTRTAQPGAGKFPPGNFWIRKATICHLLSVPQSDAIARIGHSGPNGDLVCTHGGSGCETCTFDADAAPLFTAGEYFDVHHACSVGNYNVQFDIFWLPAP